MLAMEVVLGEVIGEDINEQGLPPGFRFHPTDEELVTFYLASKVFNGSFSGVEIAEVDLNRCEPWELPDVAKMGEREWYLFSLRDRKYPSGLRTNRATGAGYWKATGKDREVYSASNGALLGMKKTLVFYRGRAPRGQKTLWVMHEYRLDGHFSYRHRHCHTCKEDWVICRIFHKTGNKKNPPFQGQSCPPLLENPSGLLVHHQENDLKNQTSPNVVSQSHLLLPSNGFQFQQSFSPMSTTIPKQCKTEADFSHFQLAHDANLQWMDKIHQNPYQNPLFFETDCSMLGFSAPETVRELSTSLAFQMMVDPPPIRLPGEFWPLDS